MKFSFFTLVLASLGVNALGQNPLKDLYGKGLVISHGEDSFWQVKGSNTVQLVDEPEEYYSRFFVTQGRSKETVYVRMGYFEYLCIDTSSGKLTRVPSTQIENESVDGSACEFTATLISGDENISSEKLEKPDSYILQAKNGRYLKTSSGHIQASAFSKIDADIFRIRDERDVIVDLGYLEQFLSNGKEGADIPTVFVKSESGNLMKHDTDDKIKWNTSNKNDANARWKITRQSRLNNVIRIKSVGNGEHVCSPTSGANNGNLFGGLSANLSTGTCDWVPVRVNDRQYVLFQVQSKKFVRLDGTANFGKSDVRFASGAETLTFELAEPHAAAIEILDVKFDRAAIDTLGFTPDEIKTIKFKNASPLSQQQVVEFSETETITTETTWSTSFATERSFTNVRKLSGFFVSATVTASATIGFSTEQGRTHTTTEEKLVSYSKTFEVPACTDMTISIATSAVQKTTVPFIATIRQNNVDGSFKVFQQTGSHTGIALDQTEVSVETTPIKGCIPAADTRRLRGN